jgi:hypothetical protein
LKAPISDGIVPTNPPYDNPIKTILAKFEAVRLV